MKIFFNNNNFWQNGRSIGIATVITITTTAITEETTTTETIETTTIIIVTEVIIEGGICLAPLIVSGRRNCHERILNTPNKGTTLVGI